MASDQNNVLLIQERQPRAVSDGLLVPARGGSYGENTALSILGAGSRHLLADEGSYFTAGVDTSKGYASSATSYSATVAYFAIQNLDFAGGRRIYMDRFWSTGAGSQTIFTFVVDSALRIPNTIGGANVPLLNPNSEISANRAPVIVWAPAVSGTLALGAATPLASIICPRAMSPFGTSSSLNVFFGSRGSFSSGNPDNTSGNYCFNTAPAVVGPGSALYVHAWRPAGAGSVTIQFEFGFWLR